MAEATASEGVPPEPAPEEAAEMRAEETRLLAIIAPDQRRPETPY